VKQGEAFRRAGQPGAAYSQNAHQPPLYFVYPCAVLGGGKCTGNLICLEKPREKKGLKGSKKLREFVIIFIKF
jgi:hypothetical protein